MTPRRERHWPHWLAPFLASLVAAIVFHALGHNPFTELYGAGDAYITGLPSKIFAAGFSSWNPWVQLGHYTYQDTQYQPFYLPGLIVMRLWPSTFGYNVFILAHFVAAGLIGYLYFRNLGLGRFAATFGGLAFELSGFLSAHKGHTAIVAAAIWLPLMLYSVDRFFATGRIRALAIGAIAVSMSVFGGFAQITLYSALLTGAYACWRAATLADAMLIDKIQRLAWAIGIIFGLGAVTAAIQIVPVVASMPELTRERLTYEMFSQDALTLLSLPTFIVPNLFGGLYGVVNYAPNINFVELYAYMGLLPLALAAGAAFVCGPEFKDTRFWAAAAIVALALAFGPDTPLHQVLFRVPVYNLFRNAARHLLEVNFAICVLAAFAVHTLLSPAHAQLRRRILRSTAAVLVASVVAGFLAAWAVAAAARHVETPDGARFRNIQRSVLHTIGDVAGATVRNLAPTSPTLLLPSGFLVLSLGVLVWLGRNPHSRMARSALMAVVAADLYTVHAAIYDYPDTRPAFRPESREEILALRAGGYDPARDRAYPLEEELVYTYPVLNTLAGISAINDYGPMWGKRYQHVSRFYNNGLKAAQYVADVRFLSITSARFVLTRSPGLRARLLTRSLPPGAKPVATRAPSAEEWTRSDTESIDEGFRLRRAGDRISMASLPLELRPNTVYNVDFEARAVSGQSDLLIVDFYGPGYDTVTQDRLLSNLPQDFEVQRLTIDAGNAPPANSRIRIFTASNSPIDVRRVRIMTMPPAETSPFRELTVTQDGISVFENPHALPRFRFATDLLPAADVRDARRIIEAAGFDFARSVTVEGLAAAETVEPGSIVSQAIDNTALHWRVRTGNRSFFVVGDTFFPGWTATIDGAPARIYAVDGFLRGLFVDGAGEHDIRMEFRPEKFWAGASGTVAGIFGLIAVWFRRVRRSDI